MGLCWGALIIRRIFHLRLRFGGLIFRRAYLFIYIFFLFGGGGRLLSEFYGNSSSFSDFRNKLHEVLTHTGALHLGGDVDRVAIQAEARHSHSHHRCHHRTCDHKKAEGCL